MTGLLPALEADSLQENQTSNESITQLIHSNCDKDDGVLKELAIILESVKRFFLE